MKKLIIAPNNMHHDILLKYRQDNPFNDVKNLSKESLIGEWKGRAEKSAINYLMKKHDYSYDHARMILPFLPFINEKMGELYLIKNELIDNHLLISNKYLNTFFENKEVLIIGYSKKDKELLDLLNTFHIDYQFEKENEPLNSGFIKMYETSLDETFYTLNEIAALIDEGKDINDIYILNKNNDYKYYLEKFFKDFGFALDIDTSYPLFETSLASSFLKEYMLNKDVNLSLENIAGCKDEELLNAFKETVLECVDEELSFSKQFDYIVGELKTTRYCNKHLRNVVKIIDRPIYRENVDIFVLGFAQGIYPESNKDNRLLSDKEKEIVGINTSLDETLMFEEIMQNFFSSNNRFHFSFAHRSLSQKYFLSPWAQYFDLKETKVEFPHILYSRDMADYYYAKALDLMNFYSEKTSEYYSLKNKCDIPYGIYNNEFSGVDAFDNENYMTYSYSSINTFYKCPFQYYLSRVLDVDPFEGNFSTKFGNVAHAVFEHQYEKDFDFEKTFNKYVEENEFSLEELPIINNLKAQIKEASDACLLHRHYMKNPNEIFEKDISVKLSNKSQLRGKIDKSIILDNKYLAIVDYKTGNDSFNASEINEGVSLQLPTYCLLAENDADLKKYQIMGVFINNVIDTSLKHEIKEEQIINPYYRLNGKVAADIDVISYLDNTISGGKTEFIKGVTLTKDSAFSKNSNALASFEEIKEYARVAFEKYQEADQRIRNNEFSINPLYHSKSDNACAYCNYRDICYVKPSQRRYIKEEDKEESEDDENE